MCLCQDDQRDLEKEHHYDDNDETVQYTDLKTGLSLPVRTFIKLYLFLFIFSGSLLSLDNMYYECQKYGLHAYFEVLFLKPGGGNVTYLSSKFVSECIPGFILMKK